MRNENFGLFIVNTVIEGVALAEHLSEKNIKTVNINFREGKCLKESLRRDKYIFDSCFFTS